MQFSFGRIIVFYIPSKVRENINAEMDHIYENLEGEVK